MHSQIQHALDQIVAEEGVRILLAVESGSRAWGFESADSDWDVRFIYVRPLDWYLSIDRRRDVIERQLPGDLDIAGWDLPKALGLYAKCNPSLHEWLRSPLVYRQEERFVGKLRALEPTYLRLDAGIYHYRSMAKTNFAAYLSREQVVLKKYLYCLRPLLACQYLLEHKNWPPVRFSELIDLQTSGELRGRILALVEAKRHGDELGEGVPDPVLHGYIEKRLSDLEAMDLHAKASADHGLLNELLRETIKRNRL